MYQELIKPALADIKTFVLDTLFPIYCLRCESEGEFICMRCLPELSRLEFQHCIVCQKPSIVGITHPLCQTAHGADGLISILNYHDEAVADIIIKGKYNFLPDVYKILGKIMAQKIKEKYMPLIDDRQLRDTIILVPLPLHRLRLRWRGFNQAEILCKIISRELNLPTVDVLIRTKSTKTQKDLKRPQRIKNVSGAFALKSSADVRGQNLILIDDVTTTGSTLLEAAQVLKRNGANKVWCLTVARD